MIVIKPNLINISKDAPIFAKPLKDIKVGDICTHIDGKTIADSGRIDGKLCFVRRVIESAYAEYTVFMYIFNVSANCPDITNSGLVSWAVSHKALGFYDANILDFIKLPKGKTLNDIDYSLLFSMIKESDFFDVVDTKSFNYMEV